jgi:hypothetical protein
MEAVNTGHDAREALTDLIAAQLGDLSQLPSAEDRYREATRL